VSKEETEAGAAQGAATGSRCLRGTVLPPDHGDLVEARHAAHSGALMRAVLDHCQQT